MKLEWGGVRYGLFCWGGGGGNTTWVGVCEVGWGGVGIWGGGVIQHGVGLVKWGGVG